MSKLNKYAYVIVGKQNSGKSTFWIKFLEACSSSADRKRAVFARRVWLDWDLGIQVDCVFCPSSPNEEGESFEDIVKSCYTNWLPYLVFVSVQYGENVADDPTIVYLKNNGYIIDYLHIHDGNSPVLGLGEYVIINDKAHTGMTNIQNVVSMLRKKVLSNCGDLLVAKSATI